MKIKSKKAAAKRFRFTATGQVKFKRANKRHILSKRSSKNKLQLRAGGIMMEGDRRHVVKCLPNGRA